MDEVPYDEFGLFHENAEEYGLAYDGPPVVRRVSRSRRDGRRLSSLVWGYEAPELVLLHGGAQNAHTWDTVALALGRPLIAVDLPGHGHSDGGPDGSHVGRRATGRPGDGGAPAGAPRQGVVGMSLGGLSALALAQRSPELVRRLVLVDITPGVNAEKAAPMTAFIDGPASLRQLRRPAGPHDRAQPHPVGVVSAPGHPPQRGAARRRHLGVALRPVPGRASPVPGPSSATCGRLSPG